MSNLNIDRFNSILSFDGKIKSEILPESSGSTFSISDSYLTVKTTNTPIGKRIVAQILGSSWTTYAFNQRQIFLYGRASHGVEVDLRSGFLVDSFIDIYGFSVQLNNNTAYSEGYIGMHACYYTGNIPAGSDAIGCTH